MPRTREIVRRSIAKPTKRGWLADDRGIAQDEQHKEYIAQAIKNSITTVGAVLILANGTVPRLGVVTDYVLSFASSMFPNTLAKNIGFLFTNVSSPLNWYLDADSLPDVWRHKPMYLLDNPVAMQRKLLYLKQKMEANDEVDQHPLKSLDASIQESHKKALEALVKIFSWEKAGQSVEREAGALAEHTSKAGQLLDGFAGLSLSGSFAGQLRKEVVRSNSTDEKTIKWFNSALRVMKAKLEFVEEAKQEARKKPRSIRGM
ncbi:hypothetical protein HYDPIDRAFT_26360 [Hydnomerulius pinastri MD-312]|nr:hypothetical protein HYDPIDRAFT_26360 [Hydnomerulius pinastri MD-312]